MADPQQSPAADHHVVSFHGELFRPSTGRPGSWPGIVLIHSYLGLNDSVRSEAAYLAKSGFQVLAVNLFEGQSLPGSIEEGESKWDALDPRMALVKCQGAMSFLQNWSSDPEQIAAVGTGGGGTLAIKLLVGETDSHLKAVVDEGGSLPAGVNLTSEQRRRILVQTAMVPNQGEAVGFLRRRLALSR